MSKYLKLFSRCTKQNIFSEEKKEKNVSQLAVIMITFLTTFFVTTFKISIIFSITWRRNAPEDGIEYLYVWVSKTQRCVCVCVVRSAGAAIENVTRRRRVGHTTFRFQHFSWCTREGASAKYRSLIFHYRPHQDQPSADCPKDNGQ